MATVQVRAQGRFLVIAIARTRDRVRNPSGVVFGEGEERSARSIDCVPWTD